MIIGCPVFTPYTNDNKINKKVIKQQAELLKNLNFDLVLVGGTTGDWALLTLEERIELIKEWSKQNIKVLAHVSDPCIKNVHTLIDVCKKCKIWAVLIGPQQIFNVHDVTKYLIKATKGYPFIYYHFPDKYGYDNCKIEQIPNMLGVKYSGEKFSKIIPDCEYSFYPDTYIGKSTFTYEFCKKHINTNKILKIKKELKNNKNIARTIIEETYGLMLGKPRLD